MKSKITFSMIILVLLMTTGFAQEKSQKQIKEELKIEKRKQIDSLVNAKTFDFVGKTAYPSGTKSAKSVNISNEKNYIKFQPDLIDSHMPIYGVQFNTTILEFSGNGYNFKGSPEEFTITKGKKNYQVSATVLEKKDKFRISLTVNFNGSASLNIINNTLAITYSGEIKAPDVKDEIK